MTDTIQDVVKVRFARKPSSLKDMADFPFYEKERDVEVSETVTLTADEYDTFTADFFDSPLPCSSQIFRVVAENRADLIVNTEGYDYARYVAFDPAAWAV